MKSIFIKLVFIISTTILVSIIGGVLIYSINYIEKNPYKYIPIQNKK